MLLEGINDAIETDFDILEAIGAQVDDMIGNLMPTRAIQKT